jgi:hypothetical protein
MELNQSIENPLGAGTQVGQAEAFVYTPNQNVFATIQGALDKNLQLQQDNLKKKEEAKKKQDAEFDKLMMDLNVDSKWDRSLEELSEHIDNVGKMVYDYRASGKPADVAFYTMINKEKARQNSLVGMNEKTFNEVTKIEADMLANEKIDKEDYKIWKKGLDSQKDIESRFDYTFNQPRPGEYFDILKPFKDYFSEEEQQNRLTKTDETKQAKAEKAVWESRNPTERERMLRLAGKNLDLKDKEGMPRSATQEEYLKFVHDSMKPFYVKQQTPAPTGGSGSSANKPTTWSVYSELGKSQGFADTLPIPKSNTAITVVDNGNNTIQMLPFKVQYTGKPGESNPIGGWQVLGKKVGSTQTKTFTSKEEADAWTSSQKQGGTIAEDATVDEKGVVTFKTIEDVAVPYDWNVGVLEENFPGIDLYGKAAQFNSSKGDPGYYRRPKQFSESGLNADSQTPATSQGVNLIADQQ